MFQLYDPTHYPAPIFVLLSGGLMLARGVHGDRHGDLAVTPVGVWIYGRVIGVVTVMIRYFGGLTKA